MTDSDGNSKGNGMIWVAAGCGGLLLLLLCVATGFGVFTIMDKRASMGGSAPMPMQSSDPSTGPMMPSPGGSPGATASVEVTATVTSSTGSRPAPEGAVCSFRVEHLPRSGGSGYWCRTQAVCGGQLLFGGPTAGYFNCDMTQDSSGTQILGADPDTTSADNDGSFAIDTNAGTVVIRDDSTSANGEYSLVAHISSVQ